MKKLQDNEWIRQSFMLPAGSISDIDAVRRTMKDASVKFTDSSLGGNFAVNPPPQFTQWADLPVKSKFLSNNNGVVGSGMGRYYSEAIDNNANLVHMRFGVPKFNSLTAFFGGFYNPHAASLANTGRGNGVIYTLAKAVGHVVTIPFQPFILANRVVNFLLQKPLSKYYYLKPTMVLYWNAVQTIVNALAVNMGLARNASTPDEKELYANEPHLTPEDLKPYIAAMSKGSMDFWTEGGTIDILKVVNRAQIMANEQRKEVRRILEEEGSNEELSRKLLEYMNKGQTLKNTPDLSFNDYRDTYYALMDSAYDEESSEGPTADRLGTIETGTKEDGTLKTFAFWLGDKLGKAVDGVVESASALASFMEAEFQDGSQFVTFRVDNPGTFNESFSNSTKESGIASTVNSASSAGRSARFNFADGNTGVLPIDAVIEAGRNALTGLADGVALSGLTAFTGAAFADIPKTWDGSTANLPRADYTIELRSPYGNKLSRFMNLYVPLAMLLAGSLPLSTGKQSYTSPFICELYAQGKNQIRLGMIESLSITRGSGNIGWTPEGEPLGIDVSFSVVDLSTIMHVPIHTGNDLGEAVSLTAGALATAATGGGYALAAAASTVVNLATKGMFDDDNAFTDYMAVLGGLSLTDQVYSWRRLKIAAAKRATDFDTWTSVANVANFMMGVPPARLLSGFAVGMGKGG